MLTVVFLSKFSWNIKLFYMHRQFIRLPVRSNGRHGFFSLFFFYFLIFNFFTFAVKPDSRPKPKLGERLPLAEREGIVAKFQWDPLKSFGGRAGILPRL